MDAVTEQGYASWAWEQVRDLVWLLIHQPRRWWCLTIAGHAWDGRDPAVCRRCAAGKGW